MANSSAYFSAATFEFLDELAANNNRDWFTANKDRYEEEVKAPALRFINDIARPLHDLSPRFPATPRSMFRIYRDTRFSPDKRPYKTHLGIHFRHEDAKHPHTPGFYLHIQPGQLFAGLGVWRPDSPTLGAIRDRIVEKPAEWRRATRAPEFRETFEMEGDRLKRPPKGYDPGHELIDDLKRKDFVGMKMLTEDEVAAADFPVRLVGLWHTGAPFMRFLCAAIGTPFDA